MRGSKCLPFGVGEVVEARSFQRGYRGAWFKCKIKEMTRKRGRLYYALEYLDFPDEKVKWTKVYQVPPQTHSGKSREVNKELMVRPSYPPHTLLFDNVWKVGDLVDCCFDACYWSANLTKILPSNKAQVDLMPIPTGEGLSYTVRLKDVRPSLEWSPQHGWTLPVSQDGENNRCCGHLVHPESGVSDSSTVQDNDGELSKNLSDSELMISNVNRKTLDTSSKLNCAEETSIAKEVIGAQQTTIHLVEENEGTGKRKRSYSKSCDITNDVSDEEQLAPRIEKLVPPLGMRPENNDLTRFSQQKYTPCEESSLDMDQEASVLHLVELTSKVKWLKGILQSGSSFSTADAVNWKIIKNRAAPSSK